MLFSHEFMILPVSSSPSKVQASVFMNMEPALSLPLIEQNVNPKVWADGKTVGQAQMLLLLLSSSKTLTYFHIEGSTH